MGGASEDDIDADRPAAVQDFKTAVGVLQSAFEIARPVYSGLASHVTDLELNDVHAASGGRGQKARSAALAQ